MNEKETIMDNLVEQEKEEITQLSPETQPSENSAEEQVQEAVNNQATETNDSPEASVSTGEKKKKGTSKKKQKTQAVEPVEEVALSQEEEIKEEKISLAQELAEFIKDESIQPDEMMSTDEQNRHFGPRVLSAIKDGSVLQQRFSWKKGYGCQQKGCTLLLDLKTGKRIGVLPRLQLAHVWRSAAYKGNKLTEQEWNEQRAIIERRLDELNKDKEGKEKRQPPYTVQDLFAITESDYLELFLRKASQCIALFKAAVFNDIAETERLADKWEKIKLYKYKVELKEVFCPSDVEILKKHGINYLNELRFRSVYDLKNMMLSHSFKNIIKEINAAYREDRQRRKDRRHQVVPFLFGIPAIFVTMCVAFSHKYTLIKNLPMTRLLMVLLVVWGANVLRIIWACVRAKLRRKKRTYYRYFTKKVRNRMIFFALLSIITVSATTVFYERYDGYNDVVYYRDLDDGTIAVAGLVNEDIRNLEIPMYIDGKVVTKLDENAFKGDLITSVQLPYTVTTLEEGVFEGCENLFSVSLSSVASIPADCFAGCESLVSINIPTTVTSIGKNAFEGCYDLRNITGGVGVKEIAKEAFYKCTSLKEISFDNVETIGKYAFQNCDSLSTVALNSVVTIEKKAFDGCYNMQEIVLGNNIQSVHEKAFLGCAPTDITLPCIGLTPAAGDGSLHTLFPDLGPSAMVALTLTNTPVVYKAEFEGYSLIRSLRLTNATTQIEAGAFANNMSLQEIYLPSTVQVLPAGAFENCANLRAVYNTEYITDIQPRAFYNCYNLGSVEFINVESVGDSAFYNCYNMGTIQFANVERIGDSAFAECAFLRSLGDISNLREIGSMAFMNTSSLYGEYSGLLFLSNVNIGEHAFKGSAVYDLQLSGNVTLGEGAFASSSLRSVDLSQATIINAGKQVFKDNTQLRTLTLPDSMTNIPESFVEGCNYLSDVVLPSNVQAIGAYAFYGAAASNYSINVDQLILPEGLKSIGTEAFASSKLFYRLVIPKSVESIGKNAFANCSYLREVELPYLGETRTSSTGYSAIFEGCSNLTSLLLTDTTQLTKGKMEGAYRITSIVLSDGLESIGYGTFSGFGSLQSITLPDTLTKIDHYAFQACTGLYQLNLPDSLTTIGDYAFGSCSSLSSLEIPESVTSLGKGFAKDCSSLASVSLPNSLVEIPAEAFQETNLQSITLGDAVKVIGEGAFERCTRLSTVVFNTALTTIEKEAFMGCSKLTAVDLPDATSNIGEYAFKDCTNLAQVSLNKVKKIGARAFEGCGSLSSMEIPDSVTEIGEGALMDCKKLTELSVPFIGATASSTQKIGWLTNAVNIQKVRITKASAIAADAFKDYVALKEVYIGESVKTIGDGAFVGCTNLVTAYVPKALKDVQKAFPEKFEVTYY